MRRVPDSDIAACYAAQTLALSDVPDVDVELDLCHPDCTAAEDHDGLCEIGAAA